MHFSRVSTAAAVFASAVSAYSATGRTFAVNHFYGKGPLLEARLDPIISPGGPSGHVHTIQGGNAFAETMGDSAAIGSTCTSSLVKADKSNYWTPKVYFQAENGSLHDVDLFYMNVYYFFEATTDKITAFQPGHRMVIGNPALRTPPATGGKTIIDLNDGVPQPVQFTCPRQNTNEPLYPVDSDGLHGAGIGDPVNKGAGVGFPDQNCDGYASPLRADIHFPSCYDPSQGLDAYKTNMQFPTKGNCPEGWIHTPHLFYEVYWNTPAFANEWTPGQGKQPFVLAQGDPTGYGLHADFISGWDVDALQSIIDTCDAGDSGMDKCPNLIGGLNDPSTSCNLASPLSETITGWMDALPGNNPVGQWGVQAAAGAIASAVSAATSTLKLNIANAAGTSTASSSAQTPQNAVAANAAGTTPAPSQTTNPGAVLELATSYASETTVIWTTVTASGSAPTSTSTSSPSSPVSGWSYTGCFTDTPSRILTGITFANVGQHAVSNSKCIAYCASAGFSIAGTEYGGQCFCGNSLSEKDVAEESACEMPCEGDASQMCGGSMALSVYSKSAGARKRGDGHFHRHLRGVASS